MRRLAHQTMRTAKNNKLKIRYRRRELPSVSVKTKADALISIYLRMIAPVGVSSMSNNAIQSSIISLC